MKDLNEILSTGDSEDRVLMGPAFVYLGLIDDCACVHVSLCTVGVCVCPVGLGLNIYTCSIVPN